MKYKAPKRESFNKYLEQIRSDIQAGRIQKLTVRVAADMGCSAHLCREIQLKLEKEGLLERVRSGRGSEFRRVEQ